MEIETRNQIIHLEYENIFRDVERKNRNCEYSRRYYFKNREKIIKEKMEYNKTNKNFKEIMRIFSSFNYYY